MGLLSIRKLTMLSLPVRELSQEERRLMSRENLSWLLGVTVITLVGLSLSFAKPPRSTNLQSTHKNISLWIDVLDEVQSKYVKELDEKQMRQFVENGIDGALQSLDPHSNFINTAELAAFNQRNEGKFSGVGIRITLNRKRHPFIEVESPMVGTPAHKAGILPEDIIIKVDGKSTENMKLDEVAKLIQGKKGEAVNLTILRRGVKGPMDVPVVRDTIAIDSVIGYEPLDDPQKKWEYVIDKKNKVAYVRIEGFTETTVDELAKVVVELQDQGINGLILDLRNNPGGLLKSAVQVSSMFLPANKKVVTIKGRKKGNQKQEHTEYSRPVHYGENKTEFEPNIDVPIVIILNGGSASASEIVAAALKDHLRAIIVGARSYGKGSVQNVIFLEGGESAIKLTTASYWRPNGRNIHRFPTSKEDDDWGVKPSKIGKTDYTVEFSDEERIAYYKHRREKDILGKAKQPDTKEEKKEEPFEDRQLNKALEYLRAKITGKKPAPVQPKEKQKSEPQARLRHPLSPQLQVGWNRQMLQRMWVLNDDPQRLRGVYRMDIRYC